MEAIAFTVGLDPLLTRGQQLAEQFRMWKTNNKQFPALCNDFTKFEKDLETCISRLRTRAADLPQESQAVTDTDIADLTAYLESAGAIVQSMNKRISRRGILQFVRAGAISRDCEALVTTLHAAQNLCSTANRHIDVRCGVERLEIGQREIVERLQNSSTPSTTRESTSAAKRDGFRAYYDVPYDTSKLVFDFDAKDERGNASTQEGRLLQLLLDESQGKNREVAVRGIGGVGKTSLLRKIRCLDSIKELFKDGVYSILLGKDATRGELIESLSSVIQSSGGNETADVMRAEDDMKKVMKHFRSWFAKKQCLFIVDDVWETKEISSSMIHGLIKLHVDGRDSKVLVSTRSREIASEADKYFALEPRGAMEYESRAIVLRYSQIKPKGDKPDMKAMNKILKYCDGLPLCLAVAGKVVKTLSFRHGYEGSVAYHVYAENLECSMQSLINTSVGDYDDLSARLEISIELLEERKEKLGFRVETTVARLHRRLSVITKQTRVPMSMLKHLWELEDENQAAAVAREFEQVGLADMELERRESGFVEMLRLHDSVYAFAMSETIRHGEPRTGHEIVVRGYGQCLTKEEVSGEWWHPCLKVDGYIHGNICRHLLGAGRASELVELLLKPKWTARQLSASGIPFLMNDLSTGIEAARKGMLNSSEEECCETEEVLQLISDAVTLSSPFISKNHGEVCFQLHGRLKRYADEFKGIREYVGRVEAEATRPAAVCLNDFLGGPGGSNTKIISTDGSMMCMVMLGDGERAACGSGNGFIYVVNIHESEIEKRWKAHEDAVWGIAVGRNGTRLVSGSWDGTAKVFDAGTGECVARFEGHTARVFGVAVLKDDKRAVSVSSDGSAQVWEIDSGRAVLPPLTRHEGPVLCVVAFGDGEEFVTGGADGTLRVWSAASGDQVGAPFEGHEDLINCVDVTRDQRRIVSGSQDGTVRIWDVDRRTQIADSLKGDSEVWSVAVSSDGSRIVSGSWDGKLRMWNSASGTQVGDLLQGHGQTVFGVAFVSSVDSIVSCSLDGTVRVWDARRKNVQRIADRHNGAVYGVSFSPNGKLVVSASLDKTLRIWEPTTGEQNGAPLTGHSDSVNDVAETPDGRLAVSVSKDETVGVWDLESRQLLCTLTGHTDDIWCVAVTPNGTHAVTGSGDNSVRIWDMSVMDGTHVILEGHSAAVLRVFVTDDGLRIVSAGGDGEVFVWDLETHNVVKRLEQEEAWRISRLEVFNLVEETTVHDNAGLSIPLDSREIVYGEQPNTTVLATLESPVLSWALSPDKKTVCVGLLDGNVAFLKLET